METKTAEFLSKLMLEDDEDDIVSFAFPNQKRKIKCSISMLAEISTVFEAMFSARWCQEKVDDIQPDAVDSVSQDKTIQLNDEVNFDQYLTFKLMMQILYGLRKIDSLTVDQATNIYYYSDKYQLKDVSDKIKKFLNVRMESGISATPFSVAELTESIGFCMQYNLDEFKVKLDGVKLAFDDDNPIQFWDLTTKFEMKRLQQQILDHVKTVPPRNDWTPDFLIEIVRHLQTDNEKVKKVVEKIKDRCNKMSLCHHCRNNYNVSVQCHYCGINYNVPRQEDFEY